MSDWNETHLIKADVRFDGGDLDCGNGLLLLIRKHIDPLHGGQHLELQSTDATVEDDLPAWCRMTGNALVSRTRDGVKRSYLIRKREAKSSLSPLAPGGRGAGDEGDSSLSPLAPGGRGAGGEGVLPPIPNFAVMGVGSWPRPGWMLRALHDKLSGKLDEETFQQYADDAVRLCVAAQERAGVDVITDGEQRRDNYASFVGARLDNCQLIPITDLLPYVTDPDEFAKELQALDVPAEEVRHPAVFGPLKRSQPLAVHELQRLRQFTDKPIKIALPGPYLLTRTMWLECVADKAYTSREALAEDIVRVLREELTELLDEGAAIVQFDEPVLTEVVFARENMGRSFMCGALSAKQEPESELAFAGKLIHAVLEGFPRERLALHVCRGNWSRDESVALTGPYTPLIPMFSTLPVGTFFLEMATPRAGEIDVLQTLPRSARIGLGVVNQKLDSVESVEAIIAKATEAMSFLGRDRIWLNPDCGFATFADNPIASAEVAEVKLKAMALAAKQLRGDE